MIGCKAIDPLIEFLLDPLNEEYGRATAAESLKRIADENHSVKEDCISGLTKYLINLDKSASDLNGIVISCLLDLNAVNSIDAIRTAFDKGNVDISVAGDLEDVEIKFGLRKRRTTPKPDYDIPHIKNFSEVFNNYIGKKKKIVRNDPCPCGSGKKYKKCCLP